jgi:hypothetical protein
VYQTAEKCTTPAGVKVAVSNNAGRMAGFIAQENDVSICAISHFSLPFNTGAAPGRLSAHYPTS